MGKKILVISASFRKGSNSDMLADEFIRGAEEKGHAVEKIHLSEKTISFCKGCLACQKTGKCVINDDGHGKSQPHKHTAGISLHRLIHIFTDISKFQNRIQLLLNLLFGQMKTMLDRANPLYVSDYAFRDVYMLMTAADDDEKTVDNAVNGLKGWIVCFPKAKLAGYVFGGGVNEQREVSGHLAMNQAYEMGLAIE